MMHENVLLLGTQAWVSWKVIKSKAVYSERNKCSTTASVNIGCTMNFFKRAFQATSPFTEKLAQTVKGKEC